MTDRGGQPQHEDGGAVVRCFVAVPLPDHVRTLLEAARAPAREVAASLSWTRPEGWHVTLAFLGAVAVEDLAQTTAVVQAAAARHDPPVVATGPAGRFGRHVLWIGVDDDPAGALATLGADLQAALADAQLPVHRREVQPHLTLARGGRGRRRPVDDAAVAAVAPVEVTWEADHLLLLRSELGDGPARYVPLAAAPLAPGGPSDAEV